MFFSTHRERQSTILAMAFSATSDLRRVFRGIRLSSCCPRLAITSGERPKPRNKTLVYDRSGNYLRVADISSSYKSQQSSILNYEITCIFSRNSRHNNNGSFFDSATFSPKRLCSLVAETKYVPLSPGCPSLLLHRTFSSYRNENDFEPNNKNNGRKGSRFQLDALPFTVSPNQAYKYFFDWAINEEGLYPFLTVGGNIGSATITAAYAPFWYFDMNVRFMTPGDRNTRYQWRPEPFRSAYPNPPNGIIHIPGLAAYAGFTYRRSLMDPVHNTSVVFLKKDVVPFSSWMLKPLTFRGYEEQAFSGYEYVHDRTLDIFPDPWNATRERAFSVIHDELHQMANQQYPQHHHGAKRGEVQVELERISARRIYMPTYVVDYTILGITYRAFLSGCDASIRVSGVSHKSIFSLGSAGDQLMQGASSFLSHRIAPMAVSTLQFLGIRPFISLFQVMWASISKLAMRFPLIGLFGGGILMAWRKFVRPYMDDRAASAEWERQRQHESQIKETSFQSRSFYDGGFAKAYFARNEKRILRHLSGEEGRQYSRDKGHEWYKQWEEWARQQWENAQREAFQSQQDWQRESHHYQEQYQQGQSKGQRSRTQHSKNENKFRWDFNPNDPYSVLGISRGATKEEVSKAFRREMLKHHPDTQAGMPEKDKKKSTERSKLISDAYRKIRAGEA